MKRLNLVILAVGSAAAWYLRDQLGQVENQIASEAPSEVIHQGSTFWSLASIGRDLEMMQYIIAESLPIFIGTFAIIGLLLYVQLCNKGLQRQAVSDELLE